MAVLLASELFADLGIHVEYRKRFRLGFGQTFDYRQQTKHERK